MRHVIEIAVCSRLTQQSPETPAGLDLFGGERIANHWDDAPSFGDGPFRNVVCPSVNDVVLHGLPHDHALRDGNILSMDLAVGIDGWVADAGRGLKLRPGMTLALEPWFVRTTDRIVFDPDGWTIRSADGSRTAHSEHTIAITEDGPWCSPDACHTTWPRPRRERVLGQVLSLRR